MSHFLYRVGNLAGRHPWRIIAAWIFVAGAVFMLNGSQGGDYDESFSLPGSQSQRAADAIEERFPQETLYTSNVIFQSVGVKGATTSSPQPQQQLWADVAYSIET